MKIHVIFIFLATGNAFRWPARFRRNQQREASKAAKPDSNKISSQNLKIRRFSDSGLGQILRFYRVQASNNLRRRKSQP